MTTTKIISVIIALSLFSGCALSPPAMTQVKASAEEKPINSQEFIDEMQAEVDKQ